MVGREGGKKRKMMGLCLYLYAIVLKNLNQVKEARQGKSLFIYNYLWSFIYDVFLFLFFVCFFVCVWIFVCICFEKFKLSEGNKQK